MFQNSHTVYGVSRMWQGHCKFMSNNFSLFFHYKSPLQNISHAMIEYITCNDRICNIYTSMVSTFKQLLVSLKQSFLYIKIYYNSKISNYKRKIRPLPSSYVFQNIRVYVIRNAIILSHELLSIYSLINVHLYH